MLSLNSYLGEVPCHDFLNVRVDINTKVLHLKKGVQAFAKICSIYRTFYTAMTRESASTSSATFSKAKKAEFVAFLVFLETTL